MLCRLSLKACIVCSDYLECYVDVVEMVIAAVVIRLRDNVTDTKDWTEFVRLSVVDTFLVKTGQNVLSDEHTNTHIDRQTDRQTEAQTDRFTDPLIH